MKSKIVAALKVLIGLTGVLILGALGNPVWEYLLKPLVFLVYRLLLTVSTLGIDSFRNELYAQVAQGFHENSSLELYLYFVTFLLAAIIWMGIILYLVGSAVKSNNIGKIKKLLDFPKSFYNNRIISFTLFSYLVFTFGFFAINAIRELYINSAVSYYYQMSSIIAPIVTENETIQLNSRFSQIQSKKDYITLIKEMQSIASDNNMVVPEFTFIF